MISSSLNRLLLVFAATLASGLAGAGPIHDAIRRSDLREVERQILINPASIHERDGAEAYTPLMLSTTDPKNYRIAEVLLARGANPFDLDRSGLTALHHATWHGHLSIISLLTRPSIAPTPEAMRAYLEMRDSVGMTALFRTVMRRHMAATKLLLLKKADPNTRQERDLHPTPLMNAATSGITELTEMLIEHGADVNARDDLGRTALSYAGERASAGAVKSLLAHGANPNLAAKDGRTPLHFFTMDSPSVLIAMQNGADPNAADDKGETPLHVAVRENRFPAVFALLSGRPMEPVWREFPVSAGGTGNLYSVFSVGRYWDDARAAAEVFGAHLATISSEAENAFLAKLVDELNPRKEAWFGLWQPFGSAEPKGGFQWVNGEPLSFVKWGPGQPDDFGPYESRGHMWQGGLWNDYSPNALLLPWAVERAPGRLIRVLSNVADPNLLDAQGFSPLHRAVQRRDFPMVSLLLTYGADPTLPMKDGRTGLALAEDVGDPLIVEAIRKSANRRPVSEEEFRLALAATKRGDAAQLKSLLAKRPELARERGAGLWTLLHHAAFYGRSEVALALVQAGARPNATESHGYSPAHLAAQEGRDRVLEVLAEKGGSVTLVDEEGWTPLHLAAHENRASTIRVLLDLGATKAAKTTKGWTPIDLARYNKAAQAIRVLEEPK